MPVKLLITILLITVSVTSRNAFSRTWYVKVDGSGDAPTIQAGVDSAAAGDTVLVGPGAYTDTSHVLIDGVLSAVNVAVQKSIRLLSESGPTSTSINGPDSDIVLYVSGVDSTAEIHGFEIRSSPRVVGCVSGVAELRGSIHSPTLTRGFDVVCVASTCVVAGNIISDNRFGIGLFQSRVTITDNEFRGIGFEGVLCEEGSDALVSDNLFADCGVGVRMVDSSPVIVGNEITSQNDQACRGIECLGNSSPIVAGNYIHGLVLEGVFCSGGAITIEDNQIEETGIGIWLGGAGVSGIRRNIILGNVTGILIEATPSALVEGNTFDSNMDGIVSQLGGTTDIRNNIIYRGSRGISCYAGATPVIDCNNVYGAGESLYSGTCSDQTGVNGNISVDPQFCGENGSGNFFLQSDSPCVSGNHPDGNNCGLIGALGVGCGTVSTKPATWGSLKELFKGATPLD